MERANIFLFESDLSLTWQIWTTSATLLEIVVFILFENVELLWVKYQKEWAHIFPI